jgi:hypothetical protein
LLEDRLQIADAPTLRLPRPNSFKPLTKALQERVIRYPTALHLLCFPALVIAILWAPLAGAQSVAESAKWTNFTKMFDVASDGDRIVGAAVVLVGDGHIVSHHEHGYADRGRLSLDERITNYIPELRQVHNPYGSMDDITIRMLLSHSAGFQNPTWPYKQGKSWEPFEPTTWSQLVAMMPYQEIAFTPGSRYSYSNPATGAGIAAAFNTDSDASEGDQSDAFSRIRDQALELIRYMRLGRKHSAMPRSVRGDPAQV